MTRTSKRYLEAAAPFLYRVMIFRGLNSTYKALTGVKSWALVKQLAVETVNITEEQYQNLGLYEALSKCETLCFFR
jgi:hypothetical protein